MKKVTLFISAILLSCAALTARDLTDDIPLLSPVPKGFEYVGEVAQYGLADWSNAVYIARGISLETAFRFAKRHPEITYFFYTKGGQMVLGDPYTDYRLFRHGDTVFFTGEPWWGSAPGLADGYIKK